jgi:ATP-dependent helicase HrpB
VQDYTKIDVSKLGETLPVRDALPELEAALETSGQAVLVAPPGAGKTTLVPLRLLDAPWLENRQIILLEPRRLAARAAARRMAQMLGEEVGGTVGYRMRLDQKVSAKTKIIVVTEGVFARMALDDPELSGIACVIFDEFHERSLDADLGLALALDIRDGLRPDLRLLVMSATLDGARVAALLGDAPVVESLGRAFAVETRYEERRTNERLDEAVSRAIINAVHDEEGSILAFLPGAGEINSVARYLEGRLPPNVNVFPLFGAMEGTAQDVAINPAAKGTRKIVLATSIAETSITIDGVRIVIDSGYQRLPVFEPASGLTRLETVRASKASIDQRAGRAGRTAPGIAIRLWRAEQTAVLPAFTPPEILQADLTSLLLDVAAFGVSDPASLKFMDQPPRAALNEARSLLISLNALETDGRLTPDGAAMRQLALPVRLAHMVLKAENPRTAAELAVLLTERGLGGNDADVGARLLNFARDKSARAQDAKGLARRIAGSLRVTASDVSVGRMLLLAYPDRLAKARGANGRFVMANGRGVEIDTINALAAKSYLVVADSQGTAQKSRILSAAEVSIEDINEVLADQIEALDDISFDKEKRSLRRRRVRRIGSVILDDAQMPAPAGEAANLSLIDAIRANGLDMLDWSDGAAILRKRLFWLHRSLGDPWPDMSDEALLSGLKEWLLPYLNGKAQLASIPQDALHNGLMSLVPYDLTRSLATLAPTHFIAPTGNNHPIRYEGEEPVLAIRVQELFGLKTHPSIAGGKVPLLLELLSPGHKPVQLTRDLAGFWSGSWGDVRSDMRGRYPKHFWPEDPANAIPTARAKPRGT